MLAIPKAEHLDVADPDRAARWRDVAGAMEDTVVCAGESALLHGDVINDVKAVHVYMRVGECTQPATEELDTGRLAFAAHPTRCLEDNIVRKHSSKSIDVVSVEGLRPPLERFPNRHRHGNPPLVTALPSSVSAKIDGFCGTQTIFGAASAA